jgi:hypothetical protein
MSSKVWIFAAPVLVARIRDVIASDNDKSIQESCSLVSFPEHTIFDRVGYVGVDHHRPCLIGHHGNANLREGVLPRRKDIAVRSFLSQHSAYYGYTTKQGSSVYLLGANSYPFVSKPGEEWHSFINLPKKLVPESDKGVVESNKNKVPLFEVPLDVSKFEHLGPYLLKTPTDGLGTAEALYNCRLVGLYFSAHWCGRTFMLFCFSDLYCSLNCLSPCQQPAAHSRRCFAKCTRY